MKKNKRTHFMTALLICLFVGLFVLLAGRFLYIQATGEINDVSLEEWAKQKRSASYTLEAERGKIFDNLGMTLAYDRPTFRVYAIVDKLYSENHEEPKHVKDVQKTAAALAPLLDMDEKEIIERIEEGKEKELFQVEFGTNGKDLSQQLKDEIDDLELPGIHFTKESMRYYPNGMFASHIIGFARKEEGDEEIKGITGMEKVMDDMLSGKKGHITYERDQYNKKLLDPNEVIQEPVDGNDIYLTIDQKIQTLLEDVMNQVEDEYHPKRITAIVMNPKTGEIIAMSNRPSYNPNNPSDVQNWYNDVISTPFEPGSTVKMFTWAAAIDAGVYNGDELYKSGRYNIHEKTTPVSDHNGGRGWGTITFDEGLQRSSNVAASKLVWEKLGPEAYLDYLKAFDFDEKTGIDLPGEVAGQILYNYPREKISTAFGQGSTMTPIQQMKAATAIANGGKMLQPYVIKKIVDPQTNEIVEEKAPNVVGEPISEDTAGQMIDLLNLVVNSDKGTGKPYRLDDYSVIGKTGTAQIPNPDAPGYLTGKNNNIFSFLGMAPKNDPKLMMHVSVTQPQLDATESGSTPVSFIFNNVMETGLHYLNIEPDKDSGTKSVETITAPDLIGEKTSVATKKLEEVGLEYTVVGDGNEIIGTNLDEKGEIIQTDHILLVTDQPTMPNIIGWTHREVNQLANLTNIEVVVEGNGFVNSQSIKEGTRLKESAKLKVKLHSPFENKVETKENNDE
ncbi:penicillin-binding transpeptidase domain-containing protein [Virgibacillus sp. W0181]|uniref:penicillin-binding transpeptidase domain-containing protein n=1 Tax=Virgibacillus sp. W0181 TaxID=3391581 RepID=UPI003F4735A2